MQRRWWMGFASSLCGCGWLIGAGPTDPYADDAAVPQVPPGPPVADARLIRDVDAAVTFACRTSSAAQPLAWEDDTFDLASGPLHGRSGWISGDDRVDPVIRDGALQLDPVDGDTASISKAVPRQRGGQHRLAVLVRVEDGPLVADPSSVAKLEVWGDGGKQLQLYVGTLIRVSTGEQGARLVDRTALDHDYCIVLELDLDAQTVRGVVDGVPGATLSLPWRTITGLGLTGWDLPGAVSLDDLLGVSIPDPGPTGAE